MWASPGFSTAYRGQARSLRYDEPLTYIGCGGTGDEITLTRRGRPIARIVQAKQATKVKTENRLLSEQNETSYDIDSNTQTDWVAKRLAALQHARERFGGLLSSSEEFANNKRQEMTIMDLYHKNQSAT